MNKKILLICILFFWGITVFLNIDNVAATDKQVTTINTTSHTSQLSIKNTNSNTAVSISTAKSQTIKLLIYNGKNANKNSVNGIITAINSANTKNLVPGYRFTYKNATIINSAALVSYNVLVMPGADNLYIQNDGTTIDSISPTAIKNFVANGKGYMGICGGAYCGTKYIQGWINCWGLAPHVYCTGVQHEGPLTIQITTAGKQIFRFGGTISTLHLNGPVLYPSTGSVIFAKYADNIIGSMGQAAIVGDYYGKGRSVLIGPHPELDPKNPNIVANSIAWAANLPIIPPKVTSTVPTNLKTVVSRISNITIKFSENIKPSTNFNSITIKNQTTNKYITLTKTISTNTLTLKTGTRTANTWYVVTLPVSAIKDLVGTNLSAAYSFRFKTGI